MKSAIGMLAALLLLYGCAGVPQERYDALEMACAQERSALNENLALKISDANASRLRYEKCLSEKTATETLLNQLDLQCADALKDTAILAQARMKTAKIEQYNLVLTYYDDAYGPGKIPNTPKINRIENQIASLSDVPLYNSWLAAKNCDSIGGCNTAKQNFKNMISTRVDVLEKEVVGVIGQKDTKSIVAEEGMIPEWETENEPFLEDTPETYEN